jgi:hypothetical protein
MGIMGWSSVRTGVFDLQRIGLRFPFSRIIG